MRSIVHAGHPRPPVPDLARPGPRPFLGYRCPSLRGCLWPQSGKRQSLLRTCRLQGIDPYTYLIDVLQRVAAHRAAHFDQLTLRLCKQHVAHTPMKAVPTSQINLMSAHTTSAGPRVTLAVLASWRKQRQHFSLRGARRPGRFAT